MLIKKYGTNGTHAAAQKAALEKLAAAQVVPDPGEPASLPKPKTTKGAAARRKRAARSRDRSAHGRQRLEAIAAAEVQKRVSRRI